MLCFVSDFFPTIAHGCWDISSNIINNPNQLFTLDLPDNQANPGRCAEYCKRNTKVKTKYGAIVGNKCYCINTLTTSSRMCNKPCGGLTEIWPGYLCGQAGTIANVYQDFFDDGESADISQFDLKSFTSRQLTDRPTGECCVSLPTAVKLACQNMY